MARRQQLIDLNMPFGAGPSLNPDDVTKTNLRANGPESNPSSYHRFVTFRPGEEL
jgi:hypothetical protein